MPKSQEAGTSSREVLPFCCQAFWWNSTKISTPPNCCQFFIQNIVKFKLRTSVQEGCCLFVGQVKPFDGIRPKSQHRKIIASFSKFIFSSNLNLKHQFKREFILYGGNCDKVVSWYIFHARLGSYIIFTTILSHNIHQNIHENIHHNIAT